MLYMHVRNCVAINYVQRQVCTGLKTCHQQSLNNANLIAVKSEVLISQLCNRHPTVSLYCDVGYLIPIYFSERISRTTLNNWQDGIYFERSHPSSSLL